MGGQGKKGFKDSFEGGEGGRLGILVVQMMSISTSTLSTFFGGDGMRGCERERGGEGEGEGTVGGERQAMPTEGEVERQTRSLGAGGVVGEDERQDVSVGEGARHDLLIGEDARLGVGATSLGV